MKNKIATGFIGAGVIALIGFLIKRTRDEKKKNTAKLAQRKYVGI